MEHFSLRIPVNAVGGKNVVREKGSLMAPLGKKALIVTGRHSAKLSGALDDVTAALDANGQSYIVFDEMSENPLVSVCARAGALARSEGCDFIIGIGGGSSLDGARAASVYAANDFADPMDIYKLEFTTAMPLVTVGTTAGTGSEVDASSVLTSDEKGIKKSIHRPFMFAKIAYCDPKYSASMSLRQTVSTGLDALCHGLECWFSTAANETSKVFSRRSVELVYPRLREIASGDYDLADEGLREDLYHGSLWGGLAIVGSGTGFPHAAGYKLTETGALSHGIACAVFENDFIQHSFLAAPETMQDELLDIIGSLEEFYDVLDTLCVNDVRLSPDAAKEIVKRTLASGNAGRTLGGLTAEQMTEYVEPFVDDDQTEPATGGWLFGK